MNKKIILDQLIDLAYTLSPLEEAKAYAEEERLKATQALEGAKNKMGRLVLKYNESVEKNAQDKFNLSPGSYTQESLEYIKAESLPLEFIGAYHLIEIDYSDGEVTIRKEPKSLHLLGKEAERQEEQQSD